jgi:hypothetical protein
MTGERQCPMQQLPRGALNPWWELARLVITMAGGLDLRECLKVD